MDILCPQSLILFFLLFSLSALYLFFFYFRNNCRSAGGGGCAYPPHLRPYPLIGHLPHFLRNRHRMPDWIAESLAATPTNTFVLTRPGGIRGVLTANPANVEHILRAHFDNYPKGPQSISLLHDFLGDGIFNSDGDAWRVQRKTASFEFNTKSLRSFVVRCVQREILSRLLPLLERCSLKDAAFDLQDVLERFAFDNICNVAFNQDPACLAEDDDNGARNSFFSGFAPAFSDAAVISAGRFRYAVPRLWVIKKLLGVGSERRLKESIATVHDFAMQIIRLKKKENRASSSSPQAEDLLSRFIANEDHSEEFLRDIVISFMLAGKDTTSSALTWFFWLLSSQPEVEAKILDEIRSVRARRPDTTRTMFDFEELKEMHYLHAAITESMRLYPPVPFNSVHCLSDDVLPDGTAVKKGWFMTYTSYAMGRIETVWGPDCREYKPERWLEEETRAFRAESPFKYPVFHGGPRTCLGKEMAYIQMKSVAACMVERFAVEVVDKEACPEKMRSLTLRMKRGLPVRLRSRE
ncbi:cytochrome P450 CYP94D108-like [Musa acuminata AAA Group]|uniref:cytochrome P450 CYP94D108-like n=1 Tax=Musa acuminata AAA Group TaxID=214697 RepID=UPI0031E3F480